MIQRYFVIVAMFFAALLFSFGCAAKKSPMITRPESDDPYLKFLQSDLMSLQGDTGKSTSELRKLIKKNPDNAFFYFLLSQNFAREKNINEAIAMAEEAVRVSPGLTDARFFLAKLYSIAQLDADSVRELNKVIEADPKNEEAYLFLARERIVLKEYWGAVDVLKELLKVNPDSVMAHFTLGQIFDLNLKDPAKAMKSFEDALSIDPTNVTILLESAELDLRQSRTRKALSKYQEISHLQPDDVAIQLKVALIHFELKEYDQSISIFRGILAKNPEADKIRYYLGMLYDSIGKRDEAIAEFSMVPPNSGFYKEARVRIASNYRHLGKPDMAVKSLKDAIDARSKVAEFYHLAAAMQDDAGNTNDAIGLLKKGRGEIPSDETIAFMLGVLYDKAGDKELALEAMKDVLKINPQNAAALNFVGYDLATRGEDLDDALDLIQRAVMIRPDNGFMADSLGWVYFKRGEYESALRYLTKADRMQPNEPTILHHIGDVYRALDNLILARKYYKKALDAGSKSKNSDKAELDEIRAKLEEIK